MTNSKQVIWEFLTTTGTSLYTLVGTRVWSPSAPPSWRNDTAAVIYDVSETAHVSGATQEALLTANCYGGTLKHADADQVYRALYDRLQHCGCCQCASGVLISARLISGSVGEKEIETEWPFAAATYAVVVK